MIRLAALALLIVLSFWGGAGWGLHLACPPGLHIVVYSDKPLDVVEAVVPGGLRFAGKK